MFEGKSVYMQNPPVRQNCLEQFWTSATSRWPRRGGAQEARNNPSVSEWLHIRHLAGFFVFADRQVLREPCRFDKTPSFGS